MATIAKLMIQLGVDSREVKRGVDKVPDDTERAGQEAGSRFQSGFRKGLSGFGAFIAGVAKTVAVTFGAVAVAAAGIGIKTAASMQQAEIGFTTLLGSSEKAKAFLQELSDFAAKTPFEFPGVRDAARQLIGVGQSADSVIPTLTAFGDAAGALGLSQDQFQRIMLATTQAIGKGKFQAEELLQITEAGLPVWPLLSKALGKPIPELQKMASEGKLLTKDVLPLLEAQMGKDYGGAMAAQSKTLTGLWSTLTDTVNMGLGKAIMPLVPLFTRVTTAATDLADKGLKKLTAFMEGTAAPALTRFADKLQAMFAGGAGDGLANTAKAIGDAVKGLFADFDAGDAKDTFTQIGADLAKIGPVIAELIAQLPSFNDVLNVSGAVIGFVADHSDLLVKLLPLLVAGYIAVKTAQLAGNVAAAASVPLRVAEVAINHRLAQANLQLAAATRAQSVAARTAAGAQAAETAAQNAGILARGRAVVSMVAHKAATIASNVATKAWAAGQWLLNAALTANPIGLIVVAIALLVAGIVYAWTHCETFRNIVTAVWQAVWSAIKAAVDWIVNTAWPWLKQTWDNIADAVMVVWDTYTSIWYKVISFVTGLPGKISAAAHGMWDGIVAAFRGAINTLISLWNRLDLSVNIQIPDWVPEIGGKGFSVPDVFPDLPMLAKGGTATTAGSVIVGDDGPEIMHMPRGATVEPLHGPGAAGRGGNVNVQVTFADKAMAWLADYIDVRIDGADAQVGYAFAGGVRP